VVDKARGSMSLAIVTGNVCRKAVSLVDKGWRKEDPEPRVGGGRLQPKAEKNGHLTDFDG
jgi:hypothetical protein